MHFTVGSALAESAAFNAFLDKYFPRFVKWLQERAARQKIVEETELEQKWLRSDKHELVEKKHKAEVKELKHKVTVAKRRASSALAPAKRIPRRLGSATPKRRATGRTVNP